MSKNGSSSQSAQPKSAKKGKGIATVVKSKHGIRVLLQWDILPDRMGYRISSLIACDLVIKCIS